MQTQNGSCKPSLTLEKEGSCTVPHLMNEQPTQKKWKQAMQYIKWFDSVT